MSDQHAGSDGGHVHDHDPSVGAEVEAHGTPDAGPNEIGSGGQATSSYYDTGTFNLQVNSECNWTVTVATIPA